MNVEASHLTGDEARVAIGGLLQLAPADIAAYAVIAVDYHGHPVISVSAGPDKILPMLAVVQGSLIRDVLASRLCPGCQGMEYHDEP